MVLHLFITDYYDNIFFTKNRSSSLFVLVFLNLFYIFVNTNVRSDRPTLIARFEIHSR